MTIENAEIKTVTLGIEDHGIMAIGLNFTGHGWGIGTGNLMCKDSPGLAKLIQRILETAGVTDWSRLPGTLVRVEHGGLGGVFMRIGHIMEDKWLTRAEMSSILKGE